MLKTPTPPDAGELLSPHDRLLAWVSEATLSALAQPLTDEIAAEKLRTFLTWLVSNRWYLVRDEATLKKVWAQVAQREYSVDTIMDITNQVLVRLHLNKMYEDVVQAVVDAYGAHKGPESAIHPELHSKLPVLSSYATLLRNNPWFLVTLLIVQSGIARRLLKLNTERAPAAPTVTTTTR